MLHAYAYVNEISLHHYHASEGKCNLHDANYNNKFNKFYLKRLVVLAGCEDTTSSLLSMRDHLVALMLCFSLARCDLRLGGFAERFASWATLLSSLLNLREEANQVHVWSLTQAGRLRLVTSCVFVSGCGLTAGCSLWACCASASVDGS